VLGEVNQNLTVLAVALEGLVDEGAVVVRVDPEDRYRQVSPGDFQPFDDERLLPGHQSDRFGPS
jgi:hypothetical protein